MGAVPSDRMTYTIWEKNKLVVQEATTVSTVTAFLHIKLYRTRTLLSKSLSAQGAKESLAGTACTDTDMGCYVLRVSRRFPATVPLGACVDGGSKGWKRLDDEELGVLPERV